MRNIRSYIHAQRCNTTLDALYLRDPCFIPDVDHCLDRYCFGVWARIREVQAAIIQDLRDREVR
jgi:hypothetical protein